MIIQNCPKQPKHKENKNKLHNNLIILIKILFINPKANIRIKTHLYNQLENSMNYTLIHNFHIITIKIIIILIHQVHPAKIFIFKILLIILEMPLLAIISNKINLPKTSLKIKNILNPILSLINNNHL